MKIVTSNVLLSSEDLKKRIRDYFETEEIERPMFWEFTNLIEDVINGATKRDLGILRKDFQVVIDA